MYGDDLAYIHDVGFSDYVLRAAPGILRTLAGSGVRRGLVVDLGCGGGRWAHVLNDRGYDVLGVDLSPQFVKMARAHAPRSKFVAADVWTFRPPPCDAVTSVGEVLNYGRRHLLGGFFRRMFRALRPGGVFVFDLAGPDRTSPGGKRRVWAAGEDWAVLSESAGDRKKLLRTIISFRKSGRHYRRSEEIHEVQLYEPKEVLNALEAAGFETRAVSAFGAFQLPVGICGYVAEKGGSASRQKRAT